VVPVLAAVRTAAAAHPQVRIAETGDASINKAINDTVLRDLHRAELLSFPITLVVLLIAFGAVVAALLPLGLWSRRPTSPRPRSPRPGRPSSGPRWPAAR
jgi:RND superfamily putative drug exporter